MPGSPGPCAGHSAASAQPSLLLGITQITTLARRTHVHADQLASAGHLWHESAAWNLAVGAGFAWIATRRARPTGITPILTVFVAVLTLLSLQDVAAGRVQAGWLLSHAVLLAGYALVLLLATPGLDFGDPPTHHGTRRWSLRHHDIDDTTHRANLNSATQRRTPNSPAARSDTAA